MSKHEIKAVYNWPWSQNCIDCDHGELVMSDDGSKYVCDINCLDNDGGSSCPKVGTEILPVILTKGGKPSVEAVAKVMGNFLNQFGVPNEEFVAKMLSQHRTSQQSFTNLVLHWIRAKAKASFDGRDQASKRVCEAIVKLLDEMDVVELPLV